MHNIRTNFSKFYGICKALFDKEINEWEEFSVLRVRPKMNDLEVVPLACCMAHRAQLQRKQINYAFMDIEFPVFDSERHSEYVLIEKKAFSFNYRDMALAIMVQQQLNSAKPDPFYYYASRRKDIKFVVLLAAPGIRSIELIEQQSVGLLAAQGVSVKKLKEMRPMMHDLVNAIVNTPDTAQARQKALEVFMEWQNNQSKSVVRSTTGVTDDKSMNAYVKRMVTILNLPWYAYYMRLDPGTFLSSVTCSVLALNGEKDIQVDAKKNLPAIKRSLTQSSIGKVKIREIPNLNHLFQHCKKCTLSEYADIEETFAPEVLDIIGNWILEITKL